jgi:HD superfamily phosphohydrolase
LKLIKDPVHGYIPLSDSELSLVDSRPVQRLRRISQLPMAYLVYPGARHSRFDHSLGSMALADEFAKSLELDTHEAALLKASALLHDVGHTPYSHLFEEFLLEGGTNHEEIGKEIISADKEIHDALRKGGIEPEDVVSMLDGRQRLSKLVSGPIDVDRLDFLIRDSYFTGATYGIIDVRRLIYLTRIIDGELQVDSRGWGVIEELAIARQHSFLNIYFHHAVRSAQLLLIRGAEEAGEPLTHLAEMSTDEYLELDDIAVWCLLKSNVRSRSQIISLERRILPKMVYEEWNSPLADRTRRRDERRELEERISEHSGLKPSQVFVDSSLVPPLTKYGPRELQIKSKRPEGLQKPSWILEMTSKPIHIFRVYVERGSGDYDQIRDKVLRCVNDLR